MGVAVSVRVRTPVAPWKRPVPPATWKVKVAPGPDSRREIDAIASAGEIDDQQAPVGEAKQARAGHFLKVDLGRARASGGTVAVPQCSL